LFDIIFIVLYGILKILPSIFFRIGIGKGEKDKLLPYSFILHILKQNYLSMAKAKALERRMIQPYKPDTV